MPPSSHQPLVSVVVCTYNGAASLAACLGALERQTVREQIEVVVVDDGSTDGTADVARAFDVTLVVHEVNRGVSAARNTGIAAARAAIVAFTDDDCLPTERWIERLLPPYRQAEIVAVGGGTSVTPVVTLVHRYLVANNPLAPLELELAASEALAYRIMLYVRRMWSSRATGSPRAVYSLAGASMSFRREVLEQVGGFDPEIRFGGDDEYICDRVRKLRPDDVLWFEPDAEVRHAFPGTFRDVWRRNAAYGRGHARAFLADPMQRWPIMFPVPIALVAGLVRVRSPRGAALLLALVQLVLPQGILGVLRTRRLRDLAFVVVRLTEECAHDAGMLSGLVSGWSSRVRIADPPRGT